MKDRIRRYLKETGFWSWVSNLALVTIVVILLVPSWRLAFQKMVLSWTLGSPKIEKVEESILPLHWTLFDKEGNSIPFEEFKNKKVFINFWASWCGPCLAELPSIIESQNELNDEIQILFLTADDFNKTTPIINDYPETKALFLMYKDYPAALEHSGIPYSVWVNQGVLTSNYNGAAKWNAEVIREGFN